MRPFVFINCAMSADGKISTRERRQVKISGPADFARVDLLRAESDAVMVGIGTVLADDPSLTVKSTELRKKRVERGACENPVRIVVDSMARTPPDADILQKGGCRRIIAVSQRAPEERLAVLRERAEILVIGDRKVDLPLLLSHLGERGIGRVMVEGGGTLIWGLFRDRCVDEFSTFIGDRIIGGKDAPTPADGQGFVHEEEFPRLRILSSERMDGGILLRWKVEYPGEGFQA
ncbi:MAG: 2,5-diamino-6-(ribosylamino)-4(3H)-pyrimidinone 5'-phosphate reductase [Methanomicrobiaceae archaeon]|nr:2,5-diamino-6-(ribosylamino)-4(3H)-pyrimidinone 5'-phosphate reductase [Methanomicrobiaceae archaeon]